MTTKELNELAESIIELNEDCLLSGSLALNRIGIKTRRNPSDIDIYLPFGKKFFPIPEMIKYHYETEEDYDNIYYERKAFKIKGITIDIFSPLEKEGDVILTDEKDDMCLASHVIIGFKVQHSLGNSYSNIKHKLDVIHILTVN